MRKTDTITRRLARLFASAPFEVEALLDCGGRLCEGKSPRWLRPVVIGLIGKFGEGTRPREGEIAKFLLEIPSYERALKKGEIGPVVSFGDLRTPEMRPAAGAPEEWKVPKITDSLALAECLGMHPDDLGWLTMPWQSTSHYHYHWHEKRSSKAKRLIEIPKPMMKCAQTAVLREIVEKIPPHECAKGFRAGMSVFDFVGPHRNQKMVLKLDLADFFPTITSGRVVRLFMTAGYPEAMAVILARLCTNAVPASVVETAKLSTSAMARLEHRHLPQGSPVSPALANLCAFRMDCRLAGLASKTGAVYTRYADDLLFSGDEAFARQVRRIHVAALTIIFSEGFHTNTKKTRIMPSSKRQYAAGLVLNETPQVSRRDFDRLKAILTNCQRDGWKGQNRDDHPEFHAHLEGRIGWVALGNSRRGEKLRSIFEKIDWS